MFIIFANRSELILVKKQKLRQPNKSQTHIMLQWKMRLVRNARILSMVLVWFYNRLSLILFWILLKIILHTASPNFISEVFTITLAMQHYGPLQCYDNYNNLNRDLVELQKQYDKMRADQPN